MIINKREYRLKLENCRPFSINNAYYKQTFNMTRECREWRKTIINQLLKPECLQTMADFRNAFDPKKAGIIIGLSYQIPYEYFFTKQDEISRLSMDMTNIEKLLVDVLFDKRFPDRGEVDNINLDDKFIIKCISEKLPSDRWEINVRLDLYDLTALKNKWRRRYK